MIISDVSKIRGVDEGVLVTLLLGAVVPREALEVVGVGTEVGVGAGVETEEKRVAKKRIAKPSTTMLMTETSAAVKGPTQGVTVVARSAIKW